MAWQRLAPPHPPRWPDGAVALGNFDGVHLGHQELVRQLRERSAAERLPAVALTFDPHPLTVLAPARAPVPLTTLDERARLLRAAGLDGVVALPFTEELSQCPAEEFARRYLAEWLRARWVAVGDGFRFGRGRAGDAALLAREGEQLGFGVLVVPPVLEGGLPVSSTRVREALGSGAVEVAARLLGRPHRLRGHVVEGARRGRTLGFPTANLVPPGVALPADGVYAGWVWLDADRRPAVVNVGRRPTFDHGELRLEAHVLDWAGDLYGRELELAFVARLRGEQRFEGPDALVAQIRRDLARARELLGAAAGGAIVGGEGP